MKKFINNNFVISVLGCVSILIVISYALTYKMPDYYGIEGWYSFFNDLSVGYISALIFYVLQVYIPENKNSNRARINLHPLFMDLIEFIEVIISCCRNYISIDENGSLSISWNDNNDKILYYVPQIEGAHEPNHQVAIRKSKDDLLRADDEYRAKIKEIKERIDFRGCAPELLNALSKLEASNFIKQSFKTALAFEGTFIRFPSFYQDVCDFEFLKDEFKRYCGVSTRYEVRDAEDLEIASCVAIYFKEALRASTVEEFCNIAYKESLNQQLRPYISDEELRNQLIDEIMSDIKKQRTENTSSTAQ